MRFILLPTIGNEIGTATLSKWLVNPDEVVSTGRALAEFETEDGLLIVEAAAAGRLVELLVQAGHTVASGAKLARFDAEDNVQDSRGKLPVEGNVMADRNAANEGGTVVPILMPQAGNTMEEGTVVLWRVVEGDQIVVGQVICEIETDKATMEFESPNAGRLARILAPLGEPIAVKKMIALLADSDADADLFLANQGNLRPSTLSIAREATVSSAELANCRQPLLPPRATVEGRLKASPAARQLAAERGIALAAIGSGSGPNGRILSTDITESGIPDRSMTPAAGDETRRPLSKMQRAIGNNLQQSKQNVPHFYVRTTVDAGPLLAFYREQKTATGCTLNDVIVLAVGRTIREFPAVRSRIEGNEIVEFSHANIGIAVGVDDGLVVPVLLDVDTLSLTKLAAESKRVVEQARKGRLENIGKGHFTISNLGMFGVEEFSAIINPPESGILAVSAAREAVIVEEGAMRAGHQMTLTLSADHRIIDGVMAARFMQRLEAILEHPSEELG